MLTGFLDYVLLREAATDKIIVYHGTSPKNFQSIMSQGLIPNPPKKSFGKDDNTSWSSSSIKSLEGIYVTPNLRTALFMSGLGANDAKDGKLIVIAEIQPKTGFMDEDNLNRFASVVDNEYVIASLYGAILKNPEDELAQHFFKIFQDRFDDLLGNLGKEPHPNLLKQANLLLWELFVKCIQRQVAYVDKYTFRKAYDYAPDAVQPDKAKAENEFLQAKDKLTRTLKSLANPFALKETPYNLNSRILRPIGFSGANKILAIVFNPSNRRPPEVWYGKVPQQFIDDWGKIQGQWNPKTDASDSSSLKKNAAPR